MRRGVIGPMVTILASLARPTTGVPSKVTEQQLERAPFVPAPKGCESAYCRLASGCICTCAQCTWVCRA